jgi:hypothetical protein
MALCDVFAYVNNSLEIGSPEIEAWIFWLQGYDRMRLNFNVGKFLILLLAIWLVVIICLSGPLLR